MDSINFLQRGNIDLSDVFVSLVPMQQLFCLVNLPHYAFKLANSGKQGVNNGRSRLT